MLKNFRRRVLALPALTIVLLASAGLPTVALADSLAFNSGTFLRGNWQVNSMNVFVQVIGSDETFTFDFRQPNNISLIAINPPTMVPPSQCSTAPTFFFCFNINSGMLTIQDTVSGNPGPTIFTGTFSGGIIREHIQQPNSVGIMEINGILGSGTCFGRLAPCTVEPGGTADLLANKGANSASMTMGMLSPGTGAEGDVPTVPVSTPEPGSLILLVTGMMGLAAARRKLRI